MVKFDVDRSNESEFLKELNTIDIEDIPIPPEVLKQSEKEKNPEKYLEKYEKKLKAQALTDNIKSLKKKKDKFLQEQINLEKEYLAHRPLMLRIKEFFKGSRYLRAGLIQANGNIKWYDRPLTEGNIVIKKGLYMVSKKALVYTAGRPTFMYFEGNSNPIIFDHEKHDILITSQALYSLFQSKVLGEMFRSTSIGKVVGWTFATILAVGIAGMLILSATGTSLGEILHGSAQGIILWKTSKIIKK